MENYCTISQLTQSNDQYEIYPFDITDDFYKIVESCQSDDFELNFDYKILTILKNGDVRDTLSIVINESDKLSKAETNITNLIKAENKKIFIDMSTMSSKRIVVKEKKYVDDMVSYEKTIVNCNDKAQESDNTQSPFTANRKRNSDQSLNNYTPSKKMALVNTVDPDDDFGFRSRTQPKLARPITMRKKIDVLNELQKGRSIEDVSEQFCISEKIIRDIQSMESEIRQQFQASNNENHFNHSQIESIDMKYQKEKPMSNPIPKIVNKTNVVNRRTEKQSPEVKLKLFYEPKIKFTKDKCVENNNLIKPQIIYPRDVLNMAKNNQTKKPIVRKPLAAPVNHSNLIPPISEQKKPIQHEIKPLERNRITESRKSYENREPEKLISKSTKPVVPPTTLTKHPTDPVTHSDKQPPLQRKKSSTNKYEPPKNDSPFRYIIQDPTKLDFQPSQKMNWELKSTNIDSEEFIDDVHDSYERFTKCVRIYEKYNLKRQELKTRASNTRTAKEISELYKEFYRLVEEEKLPFFVQLEREVTGLHSKLSKAATMMGIMLR